MKERKVTVLNTSDIRPKGLRQLPDEYVNVPALSLWTRTPNVPKPICDLKPDVSTLGESRINDYYS